METLIRLVRPPFDLDIHVSPVRLYGRDAYSDLDFVDPTRIGHDHFIVPDFANRRPATDADLNAVAAESTTPENAQIKIFQANPIVAWLGRLASVKSDPEATKVHKFMRWYAGRYLGADYITLNRTSGNQVTAVLDPRSGLIAGMHVDNRHELPLERRIHSWPRLAVVTGEDTRWLLACFPDIITMANKMDIFTHEQFMKKADALGMQRGQDGSLNVNEIPLAYLRRGGEAACYWLPIAPNMAWQGPTDFMLHDASTRGKKSSTAYLFLIKRGV